MDRGSQLSKDDEDDEEDEEEEERRTRQEEAEEEEEKEEEATDIKSNNPHLAGGEKSFLNSYHSSITIQKIIHKKKRKSLEGQFKYC